MKEELLKLINLQAIDSEIAGFDHAIANHRTTIANREQSIADKEEAIVALKNRIELLNQKQRETRAEHEDAGARVKDRQNKMMQVQTSREHQALLKEIEDNKKLLKELGYSEPPKTLDEMEAMRLADIEGLYHGDAAVGMGVSRQTFGRILAQARKKVACALIGGKALRIDAPSKLRDRRGATDH